MEATNCAKGGISEHGRMQLPGFVAFLQSLGDDEATGPVIAGEGELGTSPRGCGDDSWGVTCAQLPLLELSSRFPASASLVLQPSLGHFVVHWQQGF